MGNARGKKTPHVVGFARGLFSRPPPGPADVFHRIPLTP